MGLFWILMTKPMLSRLKFLVLLWYSLFWIHSPATSPASCQWYLSVSFLKTTTASGTRPLMSHLNCVKARSSMSVKNNLMINTAVSFSTPVSNEGFPAEIRIAMSGWIRTMKWHFGWRDWSATLGEIMLCSSLSLEMIAADNTNFKELWERILVRIRIPRFVSQIRIQDCHWSLRV